MCKKAPAPGDLGAARRASLRSHSDAEDTTSEEDTAAEEEEALPKPKPKGRASPKRGRGKAE